FLDADDCWHPKKIELQYGWMEQHPEAVLTAHGMTSIPSRDLEEYLDGGVAITDSRKVSLPRLLLSNIFPTPSVMIRSHVTVRFPERKRFSEDFLLWARITSMHDASYYLSAPPLVAAFKELYGESGASGKLFSMQM